MTSVCSKQKSSVMHRIIFCIFILIAFWYDKNLATWTSAWNDYGLIEEVIDGDTIRLTSQALSTLPENFKISLRISGIDTPELHSAKCEAEFQSAQQAKSFTQEFLRVNKNELKIALLKWDKFGGLSGLYFN